MKKLTSSEGLLIVVELGAEWPALEIEAARNAKAKRVLCQDETESPAAFAARVAQQLGSSFPSGVVLGSVVVACSERIDERAQSGRAELVRVTASALARGRGNSLTLAACDRNHARSKAAFSSLCAETSRQWQSKGVEVKLSFGEGSLALTESAGATTAAEKSSTRTSGPLKDSVRRVA
jgi:hypothetical protein